MAEFSIVIPVYNVEDYLPSCLASIDAQTFRDFEVVLVNDGSTDSSGEICEAYRLAATQPVRIITQENSGLLQARRRGFAEARGDVVVSLDSDDALRSDALQLIHDALCESGADFCCYELTDSHDFQGMRRKPLFMETTVFAGAEMHEFIEAFCRTAKLNAVVSKAAKIDVLGVNDDYSAYGRINYGEDHLQTLALLDRASSCVYLPEPLYYYRPNPASITRRFSFDEWRDIVTIRNKSKYYAHKWAQVYGDKKLEWYTDMHTMRETCAYCQRAAEANSLAECRGHLKKVVNDPCFTEAYCDRNARKLLRFDMRALLALLTHGQYGAFYRLSRLKSIAKRLRG